MVRKRFDEVITLESDLCKAVGGASGINDIKDGEVLVDIPLKERQRPSGERGGKVFVYDNSIEATGKDLHDYTPFLAQIKAQHIRENLVCRVFVSPRVATSDGYQKAVDRIRVVMLDRYGA